MNKFTFSQIKIGDVFRHVENGTIYRLIGIHKKKHPWSADEQIDYEFMDLSLDHPWTLSKKQFMRQLKPAPETAQILYANTKV